MAGFALTFALTVSNDLLFVVRRWVQLQQAMVAVSTFRVTGQFVKADQSLVLHCDRLNVSGSGIMVADY